MPPANRSVYVMARTDGAHKIGFSREPEKRLLAIQSRIKQRVSLIYVVFRPFDAARVEHEVHWYLRDYALGGEWFSVDATRAIRTVARVCDSEDLRREQLARIAKLEKIEKRLKTPLTRHQIVRMELDGVFGQFWAQARKSAGWEEVLRKAEGHVR